MKALMKVLGGGWTLSLAASSVVRADARPELMAINVSVEKTQIEEVL